MMISVGVSPCFIGSSPPDLAQQVQQQYTNYGKGGLEALPLHLLEVMDLSAPSEHSHTHTGVTSAEDRNCHTAVSAGACHHRCSQRGPQSIPPPLGEFKPAIQRD